MDVLVLGGGPAALGLLVNAYKTNRHTALLQHDSIAILDAGISFGGGCLGQYGINSNTSAIGFLKCGFKKTRDKQQEELLTPLKELVNSNIGVFLRSLGKQTVPLSFIGHFLNYVGNHLLYYIYQSTQKRIFYPQHRALSVHLCANGQITTKV